VVKISYSGVRVVILFCVIFVDAGFSRIEFGFQNFKISKFQVSPDSIRDSGYLPAAFVSYYSNARSATNFNNGEAN
jgi:hypothetical protein